MLVKNQFHATVSLTQQKSVSELNIYKKLDGLLNWNESGNKEGRSYH
jgi:hypothetical protein